MGGLTVRRLTSALVQDVLIQDVDVEWVRRFNGVDTVTLTGAPADMGPLASSASWLDGVLVEDADMGVSFAGVRSKAAARRNEMAVTYESHSLWWWGRLCYPVPGSSWISQAAAYADVQTGAAETVARHYIDLNAGPAALVARRVPNLTVPASLGRGPTVTVTVRSDILGQLVADIGEAAALDFDVVPSGAGLAVSVTAVPDLSGTARYGTSLVGGLGMVGDDWQWTAARPSSTVALVAAGGVGTARLNAETVSAAGVTAAGRFEHFVDQRQTTDAAEIAKAGADDVAEAVATGSVTATITDDPHPSLRLGVGVPLGSLVTIELDGLAPVVSRIREVTSMWAGGDSVERSGLVGPRTVGLTDDQVAMLASARRINFLERVL